MPTIVPFPRAANTGAKRVRNRVGPVRLSAITPSTSLANQAAPTAYADTLSGLAGNDTLDGGQNDDWLRGSTGDDVMTGGQGADEFVFAPNHGQDVITDFEVGKDFITLLDGQTIQSLSEVDSDGVGGDDATLVTFADGSSVLLETVLGVGSELDLF